MGIRDVRVRFTNGMELSQGVTCSASELPTHRERYASDASAVGRLGLLPKATAPQMYNPVLLRRMDFNKSSAILCENWA